VDHGLDPDSARWTTLAETAARTAGADWRRLDWRGDKPATGLPAAARKARHRLIADAARGAGARVVLFAHTADDIAEGELMRAGGSTLGRLREWSPSPAWPEGRGLMLLRPMLASRRSDIRAWLKEQGAEWIDDPANDDIRYGRSRARLALRAGSEATSPTSVARKTPPGGGPDGDPADPGPVPMPEGWVRLNRDVPAAALAAALVCVGGGDRPPRGARLAGALERLRSGADFTAVLCGARIEAVGDAVLLAREAGEFARRPGPPLRLASGAETVWDGRWALTIEKSGWFAVPAAGRIAALSDADRAVIKALPPAVRGSLPVLIRNDRNAPVLAGRRAKAASLVGERLALALDGMTHERALGAPMHGASPWNLLFSNQD
jgi:tRNA(Ile)-lysidine synthase